MQCNFQVSNGSDIDIHCKLWYLMDGGSANRFHEKSHKRLNSMKEIINKLSSYNLFNYLLPGTVLVALTEAFTSFSFPQVDLLIALFLYYFIGLIISRIGSLFVEPFLRWTRFIRFADYEDYVEASKSDSTIETLSEQNNMYRTLCCLPIILIFLKGCEKIKEKVLWSDDRDWFHPLGRNVDTPAVCLQETNQRYIVQRIKIALKKD